MKTFISGSHFAQNKIFLNIIKYSSQLYVIIFVLL